MADGCSGHGSRASFDECILAVLNHQLGKPRPGQPFLVDMVARRYPFDIAFADQNGTKLGAVFFDFHLDVLVEDEASGHVQRDFVSHIAGLMVDCEQGIPGADIF